MPGSSPFCPSTAELYVEHLAVMDGLITITVVGRRAEVPCPACGDTGGAGPQPLPAHARRFALAGHAGPARRHGPPHLLRCPGCARRIFAERLPETAARYARRTCRAAAVLELVGFALGGRAGARLAASLGLATAPGTVLAQVHGAASPRCRLPRVRRRRFRVPSRAAVRDRPRRLGAPARDRPAAGPRGRDASRRGCRRTRAWRSSRATVGAPTRTGARQGAPTGQRPGGTRGPLPSCAQPRRGAGDRLYAAQCGIAHGRCGERGDWCGDRPD